MSKQAANETTQCFEGIFTVNNDAIVIVDHDSIILQVNPAFTKILGYEENEVLGKSFYILTSKDQATQEVSSHSPLYRFYSTEKAGMEYRFFDKQGHDVPMRFRSVIIRDTHKKAKKAIAILEHMVELPGIDGAGGSLAEKVWEAQQNFENVLESSSDAILICDNTGNIVMANKSFLQMLNYTQEEVIGKFIVEFTAYVKGTYATTYGEEVIIDDEFVKSTGSISAKLFEKGYIKNWEYYCVRKDKVHVPIEATLSVLKDKDGERRGSIVILRDITERKRAERENKKARDFLENVFKTSADGILITDSTGNITMVNDAVENMLGYPKEELLGKHPAKLIPEGEEYKNQAKRFFTALSEEDIVVGFECTWPKSDGDLIDIEVSVSLLRDNGGNNIGGVISIRNITERKKAEKEVKEAKEFLESVIENSKDGILIADEMGDIISVNTALLEMSGYKREDLIGKHASIFAVEDKEIMEKAMEKTAEMYEKGFAVYESLIKNIKNGKITNLECTSSLIKDDKGNNIAGVGIMRDVTERKKFEESLKQSEEKYRSLIENATDAIISMDKEFLIVDFNKKAEELFGYSRDKVVGKSILVLGSPSEREKGVKQIEAFKKSCEPRIFGTTVEREHLKKDGTTFLGESSSFVVELHGKYIFTVFIRDITERREMEHKLLQSEKLKSLGELSGGVAHDFNNVLAAILGRAQLLQMVVEPPPGEEERRKSVIEMKEGLGIIEQAAKDGAETVRRIQEFSRRRDDDKHFKTVNLNEIINNTLAFTSARWKAEIETKGLKINIQKEFSPLPPTSGSAAELREVFTNIINNALDAMPQGGDIKIKTYKKGSYVAVNFTDTGGGIPESIKDKIFDPFFTTKGVQSTGLGMSVSYGIIKRHRGTIELDSVEGKGTTFTIKLPISDKAIKEEKVEAMPEEQRKAKILVVEDEEQVREVLAAILKRAGHEVEVACDGNKGIVMFEKKEFDLVFTDLGMPRMSGWQVAETIKAINGRVPVAVITGWNVELSGSEIKDKWVDLIIHKPFEVNQVIRLVQEGMILRDRFKAA